MAILIDKNTRVLVQGMTGKTGQFHTEQMLAYGTKIVGGVTPGRGGESFKDVPVFDTFRDAVRQTGANASCVFVPRPSRPTPSSRPSTPRSRSSSASPRAFR